MRILHFNQFGSHRGGAEGYIADVIAALQVRGHESHLIAFTPDDAGEPIAATTYAPTPDWPASIDATMSVMSEVIARFRPDVAYLHAVNHPDAVAWIAQHLPTVAYVHAPYPVCPGSAQYLRRSARVCPHTAGAICLVSAQLERCCWGRSPVEHLKKLVQVRRFVSAYKLTKAVLVGSTYMRGLLERGGIAAAQISILPPVLLASTHAEFQPPANSRTVLYAGRLTSEKGLYLLIQALALVKGEWELIVTGEGEDRKRCEGLCHELGLTGRVHFQGWLTEEKLAANYQTCACVAVPSLWPEPFGRIGPEAFSRGRPVVAFATGGIPDWLEHGIDGYLAPAGDIGQLAFYIQKLLDTPELRTEMGRRAREKAIAAWDASTHISSLMSVFEAAIVRHQRPQQ